MFDCPCGKKHKKTSDIGRAHYRKYFPKEAAIEKDKPDPTVREEVLKEIELHGKVVDNGVPMVLDGMWTKDSAEEMYGPKNEDSWKADDGMSLMTTYSLDRHLLKSHKKRDISYIIEHCIVTKNHEELKANWRASSWEDKATHAMIPFTIDEEEKYAFLVDARNKKKTGFMRKKRAMKALKEANKPYEVPKE
jgi:hypothetical protein